MISCLFPTSYLRDKVDVHNRVPLGPKSNVAFLVDNSDNVQRAQKRQRNAYYDDCGAWADGRV